MKGHLAVAAVVVLAGCSAEPPPAAPVQTAAAGVSAPVQVKRPVKARQLPLPGPRSDHEVQVARNVTAIMRGMRAVQLEMQADSCEDAAEAGLSVAGCGDN